MTVISQLPAHLLGILAGVFMTRILGPEGKGVYSIFYADVVLFLTLFGFTISNSIVIFVSNKKISLSHLKGIVVFFITVSLLFLLLVLFIIKSFDLIPVFIPEYEVNLAMVVIFILITISLQLYNILTAYFQGLRLFRKVNQVIVLNAIYNFVAFLIAYTLHITGVFHFGLIEIIFVVFIVHLIVAMHRFIDYRKLGNIKIKFGTKWKQDFKKFIQFTSINHLSTILRFFNEKLILWFVAFYLDNWKLGIFALGIGLTTIFNYFLNPLTSILESFLSSDETEEKGKLFSIFSRIQFSIFLIVCFMAYLLSPYLIPLIYGVDFTASVQVLKILLFGVVLSSQSGIISSYFLATNKLKYNVVASIIGVIITATCAPILIKSYDLIGAAYCQLLTLTSVFLFQFVCIKLFGKVDKNLIIITKSDILFIKEQLKLARSKN